MCVRFTLNAHLGFFSLLVQRQPCYDSVSFIVFIFPFRATEELNVVHFLLLLKCFDLTLVAFWSNLVAKTIALKSVCLAMRYLLTCFGAVDVGNIASTSFRYKRVFKLEFIIIISHRLFIIKVLG